MCPMKLDRLEGEVKGAIMTYLGLRGDIFPMRNNVGAFKPDTGGFVTYGLGTGSADIVCVQGIKVYTDNMIIGRFVGIECKRERGGVQSREQREWGEQVVRYGGLYILARSVEEVRVALGEPQVRLPRFSHRKVFPR